MPTATFPPGALVKARGREWVVLPDSTDDVLLVRPIGGLDDEVVGICKTIEPVTSASFSLPNWENPGDFNSCRLLRDAARLSTRSAAGPFRSFGKIAVDPRPYQLVPLLMAMRLDPVRLLIADDVGIGKTIEACLIAKLNNGLEDLLDKVLHTLGILAFDSDKPICFTERQIKLLSQLTLANSKHHATTLITELLKGKLQV